MKVLLVADIHGNAEALRAVLAAHGDAGLVCCLGDLAGYLPDAHEVIGLVASLENLLCVAGNHDRALLAEGASTGSASADLALSLQRPTLTDDDREFLGALPESLPCRLGGRRCLLVHAAPDDPLEGRGPFWERLPLSPGLYLAGHAHRPLHLELPERGVTVVNPGSCGFPRDGDPRAACATLETRTGALALHRVAYPLERVRERCAAARWPERFFRSLAAGEWVG